MFAFVLPEIIMGGLMGTMATPVVLVVGLWEFCVKEKKPS